MRDVGSMGESEFSKLCAAVGITHNTCRKDNKGWDAFIQFPLNLSKPLDLSTPSIRAFIQVKATDDSRKFSERITLKNMLNLVKENTPAFFCFIKFNKKDFPESIYIVHIWKDLIEETLKKSREIKNNDNPKPNKIKITIRFKKENKLSSITGQSIKNAIEKFIPRGMDNYVREKIELVNTIGYEKTVEEVKFNIKKNEISKLLDFTLGITNEIDVENFILFNKRFGILSDSPTFMSESGRLMLEKINPTGQAIITLSEEIFGPGITINSDLYSSIINQNLTKEEQKCRITNNLFEIILQPYKGVFTIEINLLSEYNKEIKLSDLYKLALVLKILNRSSSYMTVTIINIGDTFFDENLPKLSFKLAPHKDFKHHETLVENIIKSYKIAHRYNIHGDVAVTINQLINNETSIKNFYDVIIENQNRYFKVELEYIDEYENKNGKVACIIAIQTFIGRYTVACIFAIISECLETNENGKLQLLSTNTDYHNYLIFNMNNMPNKEQQEIEINKVVSMASSHNIYSIVLFEPS